METTELIEIINRGEDGKHQFKANVTNETSLAQEMIAFSNSGGGSVFIGVNDDGATAGLSREDIGRLNQLVSNAASQQIRPSINPQTENIVIEDNLVMRVVVPDGIRKPYMDKNGAIWVRAGADKRKATSQEEIQRIFQSAGLIYGDRIPVPETSLTDLDLDYFKKFFEEHIGTFSGLQEAPLPPVLQNINLMKGDALNVTGVLLFAKSPEFKLPAFIVKAIAYPSDEIHASDYHDSRDISGKLADVFHQSMSFAISNTRHQQGEQGVNATGLPEIPVLVLEELIANALIHRDYFISAPVRIFVFSNRIEIISPGHLPNNLTIENIKLGNSNIRNPTMASFATKLLPYRGLGTGISRSLQAYPHIEFDNDWNGNLFKVTILR